MRKMSEQRDNGIGERSDSKSDLRSAARTITDFHRTLLQAALLLRVTPYPGMRMEGIEPDIDDAEVADTSLKNCDKHRCRSRKAAVNIRM
jgi:hypothetical protein